MNMTAITDTNGEYRFDDILSGNYQIGITDPGTGFDHITNGTISEQGENNISEDLGLAALQLRLILDDNSTIDFWSYNDPSITDDDITSICTDVTETVSITVPQLIFGDKTFQKDQVVGIEFGPGWTRSDIPENFGRYFTSLISMNELPASVTSIRDGFLAYCSLFNQPLTLPEGITSIGNNFLMSCFNFNQPLTLPDGLESIGSDFLYNCSFNSPLTLPEGLQSIGIGFLQGCSDFQLSNLTNNSPLGPITIGGGPWSI